MTTSWVAAHKAGIRLDTGANYDVEDNDLRDLQLRGAIAEARAQSYTSEDEWIVSHVFNGETSVVGRYLGGMRVWP